MRNLMFILFVGLGFSQMSYAEKSFCNGTTENPCVVQDTYETGPELNQWRSDFELLEASPISQEQNAKPLWVSGSDAPNAEGFKLIVKKVKEITNNRVKKIIDVDLRQESHLYLNGQAITLVNKHDWINLGKSHDEAIMSEEKWLRTLKKSGVVKDVLTKKQFRNKNYDSGVTVPIETIQTEKQVATASGMTYFRLTVSDHMGPRDEEVDRYVALIDTLPKNTWLHLHCRGGKGRTTTFFAMTDMLYHADQDSFDAIIKRQGLVIPFYNLTKIDRRDPQMTAFYRARYDFLKKFYQFAQDRLKGFKGSWSQWVLTHNIK